MDGEPQSPAQRRRIDERYVTRLEFNAHLNDLQQFKERLRPAIELYESLVPLGVTTYMRDLLDWAKQREVESRTGQQRAKLTDTRLGRLAAIVTITFLTLQIVELLGIGALLLIKAL